MKIRHPHSPARRSPAAASAFTLIEIVITLTIIAILASGSVMMYKSLIDDAKGTTVDSDIEKISLALLSYERKAMRKPTTEQGLAALVEKPTIEPIPESYSAYMEELPRDPWGAPYKYKLPGEKSKKGFDLWSTGPDGAEGTEDDIGNWKKVSTTK